MSVKKSKAFKGHPYGEETRTYIPCIVARRYDLEMRRYKAAGGHPPLTVWLVRKHQGYSMGRAITAWVPVEAEHINARARTQIAAEVDQAIANGVV